MVLDDNLVTYVFSPSKKTNGLTDVHLLANPPVLEESYHLLHSAHPDHYGIFLATPTDPPGEIILGEVQVPDGLTVAKSDKAIILHQPEQIIQIGDKVRVLGFRHDWNFEWEDKKFKWSRDCVAGILKSMTLSYIPPREFKDDPPITLALFNTNPSTSVTLLDYNFYRIPITDMKGFEVIIVLFASLFIDLLNTSSETHHVISTDIKKETLRLKKEEEKQREDERRKREMEVQQEHERLRKLEQYNQYMQRQKEIEVQKETQRLKMMHEREMAEMKRREEEIERETERLRRQEGFYAPPGGYGPPGAPPLPLPPRTPSGKGRHWWSNVI